MSAVIMDGKALAKKVKEEVRAAAARMERRPGLAVILVGDDPASQVYADGKKRDCAQCGIYSEEYILPAETGQEELMLLIETLNGRSDIDGILIQLPLPAHLNERAVLSVVRPDKDVDCFHPFNVGELMIGEKGFYPCTPASVMRLLAEYGVELSGKSCVIVGRSNIVGKPLAADAAGERHGHHLPHQDGVPEKGVQPGGHPDLRRRTGRPHHWRHGEGGGRGGGCGSEPPGGRDPVRRRGI